MLFIFVLIRRIKKSRNTRFFNRLEKEGGREISVMGEMNSFYKQKNHSKWSSIKKPKKFKR